jgi:hypothetical protein
VRAVDGHGFGPVEEVSIRWLRPMTFAFPRELAVSRRIPLRQLTRRSRSLPGAAAPEPRMYQVPPQRLRPFDGRLGAGR